MIFCLLLARPSPGVSTQVLRSTMSLSFTEWVERSSETSCLSNVERSKRYYALVSQAFTCLRYETRREMRVSRNRRSIQRLRGSISLGSGLHGWIENAMGRLHDTSVERQRL